MSQPLVSVVMSVHNEERYLAEAIESVLRQEYADLELIIVDDYSSDGSMDIARSFADKRIRIHVKSDEPRYLAASRNLGIALALGKYVTFQDADDTCSPSRIARQLERAMLNPNRRVVGCSVLRVKHGQGRAVVLPERHEQIVAGFGRCWNRTTIVCGTLLGPREVFQAVPYRPSFRYMQDWDQILRLAESGRVNFQNCPEVLYTYFIRPKGVLSDPTWVDYNILVRHCQQRRRRGLGEFLTPQELWEYLGRHPLERLRWTTLKRLILWRNRRRPKRSPSPISAGHRTSPSAPVASITPMAGTSSGTLTKVHEGRVGHFPISMPSIHVGSNARLECRVTSE